MGRDWERRRSPRISALDDSWNQNNQETTRMIKRRKFNAAAALSKLGKQVWKGREGPQNEDHSADYVEWRRGRESEMVKENQQHHHHHAATNGKASRMPEKNILELVLDTLQRRDTYEIFAEPIDPDEVEDYYEIIKEPMDFGTMRAKLHEGMYKNLEQFEHDVFLIPENAMHFNSSATIYFRQARAIHELAKRVFDALKMDPDNFALEYSGIRRRSMRKALSESKDPRFCIPKSGNGVCSSKGTLYSRRTSKKNPAPTGISHRFLTGNGDGRPPSFPIADRRSTYWTWMSSLYDNKDCVRLVQMVEGNIRYRESLMLFVKDLGPIAQMVAARKLLGQHGSQKKSGNVIAANSNSKAAFRTFSDFASGPHPFLKMSSNVIDLTEDGGDAANGRNGIGKGKTEEKEKIKSSRTDTLTIEQRGDTKICKRSEVRRRKRNTISPDDDNMRPVILALESSHSSTFPEFKLRNKKSCAPIAEEALQRNKGKETPLSLVVSQFTFDLPFLKARLNQMNLPISKSPLITHIASASGGDGDGELNNQKAGEALNSNEHNTPIILSLKGNL